MTWGNAQVRVSHCLLCLFVHIFFRWESKAGGVPIFRRMTFLLLLTKGGSFPPSWNDTWNVLDPKLTLSWCEITTGPEVLVLELVSGGKDCLFRPMTVFPTHGSFRGLVPWFCFPWKNIYFFWTVHVYIPCLLEEPELDTQSQDAPKLDHQKSTGTFHSPPSITRSAPQNWK